MVGVKAARTSWSPPVRAGPQGWSGLCRLLSCSQSPVASSSDGVSVGEMGALGCCTRWPSRGEARPEAPAAGSEHPLLVPAWSGPWSTSSAARGSGFRGKGFRGVASSQTSQHRREGWTLGFGPCPPSGGADQSALRRALCLFSFSLCIFDRYFTSCFNTRGDLVFVFCGTPLHTGIDELDRKIPNHVLPCPAGHPLF